MSKREINFETFGSNIIIEIGESVSKGGVVMPEQRKREGEALPYDRGFRVVCISKSALKEVQTQVEGFTMDVDRYIYLKPYADAVEILEKNGIRYAHVELHEVMGWAPEGFNLEEWNKNKEEEKEHQQKLVEQRREEIKRSVLNEEN